MGIVDFAAPVDAVELSLDGCAGDEVAGGCSGGEAPCPTADELDLACILGALSDPLRLRIVAELSSGGERLCGSFELGVAKSTCSHHFRVLREAGVLCQRIDGKNRYNRLNGDVLEERFPGLLSAVLQAKELEAASLS